LINIRGNVRWLYILDDDICRYSKLVLASFCPANILVVLIATAG
jgi:hypothetical protein